MTSSPDMKTPMKVEWRETDIVAGRVVGQPYRKERWMIGYMYTDEGNKKYTLNSLCDGLVQSPMSAAELANFINDAGDIPAELFQAATIIKNSRAPS